MSTYGYGNFGHYRGTDVQTQIRLVQQEARERFMLMAKSLIAIIGKPAYEKWIDENFTDENLPWQSACELIDAELQAYECSCNPTDDIPCAGCRRYFEARKENENE